MEIIQAARFIGAGLATIAFVGSGVGIGIVFGQYISASLRNPGAAQTQFTNLYIGYALCELQGLFGLLIALILLFT
jgi:F-type H+-transporting ATPase subunit c